MSRKEAAIFTNLCMITNQKGEILVQNRTSKYWPGIAFPGGHVESGESFTRSVIHEVLEETNLTIEHPSLCGIKQYQTDDHARYVVLLYTCDQFTGELKSSSEGEVFWITKEALKNYKLADDFLEMLPIFEKDTLNEFYYYQDDEQEWKYEII
ncbi:NUDIX domain-containing protein [Clostridiaceae bacterium DONG20-135]|uniref:NUDIX domain-containing protein n=1 Tax=Copranaerobaculum intestinale TaxID=2692629 RepID=A0A6N8U5N6_9FIRM|nr:8-oxo-dGTP diphosphatase [Copranaerobaculum intestinale]MXQ73516.1 NUDIX domain-containing protein [Copranaerobaculum intestinale]